MAGVTDAPQSWLFVNGAAGFGGHEVMLLRWLEELRSQARVRVTLLAREGSRLHRDATDFAEVAGLTASRAAETSIRYSIPVLLRQFWRDALQFARVVRLRKPDLCLVAEGCLMSQPAYALIARLLGLKLVIYVPLVDEAVQMGFGRGRLRDRIVRYCYGKLPDAWITITHEQAEHFRAWARIQRPIFCLPNTVNRRIEQTAEAKAEQFAASSIQEPVRVLVLGRFDHQKGLDFLLDLLEGSLSEVRGLHFSLVGTGPYEEEVRNRLQRSPQLRELLSVHPWADPVEAMNGHDVLLLASRFEGVPLVMLEAMVLGLPVVSSDLPGTRALLPKTCLFQVGDLPQAMAIIRRISKPEVRNSIVKRNRQCFVAHASGAAFSQSVNELTDCLLHLDDLRLHVETESKRIVDMPLEEQR